MSNIDSSKTTQHPAFQLKGTMLAITVFEITQFDIKQLEEQLTQKINEAPEFFSIIPMVLAINPQISLEQNQLKVIIDLFKRNHVQLMAVRLEDEAFTSFIKELGLIVLPPSGAREKLIEIAVKRPAPLPIAEPEATAPIEEQANKIIQQEMDISVASAQNQQELVTESTDLTNTQPPIIKEEAEATDTQAQPTKIIDTPVRSGQQIRANADLVITANVSTGAELITNGNIHLYGSMRGRAMAGHDGNKQAKVFCNRLTAELISIAGVILTEEELRRHPLWGAPAQLSLKEDKLIISEL